MRFTGQAVETEVVDRGCGFDVAAVDLERVPHLTATGGRRVYLVGQLMDDLEVEARDGVRLRMEKRRLYESCPGASFEPATGDLQPLPARRPAVRPDAGLCA